MKNIFNFKKNIDRGLPFFQKPQKGFVRVVLLVVAALVLLKYAYDIDIVGFLTQGRFKELWDKLYGLSLKGWESYKDVILRVWDQIWDFIKNSIDKIKN